MQLLISNDDGVHALGLSHLVKQLEKDHQVTVVAPDRDLSGASNSLTLSRPVRVTPHENGFLVSMGHLQIVCTLVSMGLLISPQRWSSLA